MHASHSPTPAHTPPPPASAAAPDDVNPVSDAVDDVPTLPAVATPPDAADINFAPPNGELRPQPGDASQDVQMAEPSQSSQPNGIEPALGLDLNGDTNGDAHMTDATDVRPNGVHINGDAPTPSVEQLVLQTPELNIPLASPSDSTTGAITRPAPDDGDDQPPPAKRARKLSDAEQASLAHSSSNGVNGVAHTPAAHAPAPLTSRSSTPVPITFSPQQHKFSISTVRQLKKGKDAAPFLAPVDPIGLGIPHYVNVIKHPMDFSTIERKLQSSNPNKPDPNLANPRYRNADEFVRDVKLIFSNTVTFNGPDHVVTQMGKRLEAVFDKQLKHMPAPAEPPKPIVKKEPPPPPSPVPAPSPPPTKKLPNRRPSTSVPTIRRSDTEVPGRPKREIHPPPPKDLPYADAPRKARKGKKKDDGTAEQLRYCSKILSDFVKQKKYWPTVGPFMEPVDWVKFNIPSYPKIIKKPMDLGTMRLKLDRGEYPNASRFWDDFKLVIKNCFTYNPSSSTVYAAGFQLQQWFDEKWQGLPPLRDVSDYDDDSDDDSDSEHAMAIAMMENQLATLKSGIDAIKKKKPKKDKVHKRDKYGIGGSSKSNGKSMQQQKLGKKKKLKTLPDEEVLSFEQKKDLSETIQNLDGAKLERVIQIIHEGVPEIRDSTEEIELDIDSLPASVLTKLYNYVLRPLRPSKRRSNNPGGGTGGLKRKSMDEDVEAEKIRRLEAQLDRFSNGGAMPASYARDDESQSSDSSDDSGSSGSDSD